jgi:hypothetical protein
VNNYLSPFRIYLVTEITAYVHFVLQRDSSATLQPPSFHHRRVHE